jgi:hypothetical protein
VAYAAFILGIISPWWITYITVYNMSYWFLESKEADWMTKTYLPALETSLEEVRISFANIKDIFNRTSGFLLKMFYAFLFQEYFVYIPSIYDNFGLSIGAGLG